MKKLLYFCASLLCLALAVSALILSGAAGLRLLTEPAREEAAAKAAAPAADSVPEVRTVSDFPAEANAPEAKSSEKSAPVDSATKTASAEKAVPSEKLSPRVCLVDFDKVMKNSVPGRAVSDYAVAYQKVMDKNVAALKAALANKRKRYNTAEGQKLIAQFTNRRATCGLTRIKSCADWFALLLLRRR